MLNYELTVDNLLVKGHPFLELHCFLHTASRRFDQLVETYPTKTVRLYEIQKKEIKTKEGVPVVPTQCPHGHTGLRDGQPILKQGWGGKWNCGICGLQWEEEK